MKHLARSLLLSILVLAGMAGAADAPLTTLTPFTASYEVTLNNLPFKARASQSLAPLGNNRWRLELRVESFLLDTVEYSEFRWDGANCHTIPEHYAYTRKGVGKDRSLDMRFDFARKLVTRTDRKGSSTFALDTGAEDKLGHTLAIACRVARGTRGPMTINVAWDRDVRELDYQVASTEESIATPIGTYRALRVSRTRSDSDRVTTLWVAANAGWQSVQMQHTEGDGKLFRLRLLDLQHAAAR